VAVSEEMSGSKGLADASGDESGEPGQKTRLCALAMQLRQAQPIFKTACLTQVIPVSHQPSHQQPGSTPDSVHFPVLRAGPSFRHGSLRLSFLNSPQVRLSTVSNSIPRCLPRVMTWSASRVRCI